MRAFRRVEKFLHFFVFLLIIGAFIPLWRKMMGFGEDLIEGDPFQRNLLLAGFLGTIWVLFLFPKRTLRTALKAPLIWLFVGWAIVSMLWSVTPELTFRRSLSLLLSTIYGLTLAIRFSQEEWIELAGKALALSVISSLLFGALLPNWGRMMYEGDLVWRGVFAHKNTLGINVVVSMLFFIYLLRTRNRKGDKTFLGMGIIGAGFLLIKSNSVTSILLAVLLLFCFLIILFLRKFPRDWYVVAVILFWLIAVLGIVLISEAGTVLGFFGRDISLTGRIPLWQIVWEFITQRFWLGYGYGGFWSGWAGLSGEVWQKVGWQPPQAHNAYLEIWLGLGLPGLIFILLIWGNLLRLYAIHSLRWGDARNLLWLSVIVMMLLLGMVESAPVFHNQIWWVLVSFLSFSENTSGLKHREELIS